jgi:hypothetical protein
MRLSSRWLVVVGVLGFAAAPARAQVETQSPWKCARGDGATCTATDLTNAAYRQVLVLPTGYTANDVDAFWRDYDAFVRSVSNSGEIWSTQYRQRLLYVGYFVAGGGLGQQDATFGGAVLAHPIRGYALSVSNASVTAKVVGLAKELPGLRPMAVQVLFNDDTQGISGNASPPRFVGAGYGIAKLNRADLAGGYVPAHELAHAALNFLDEYVEEGLEQTDIKVFDIASPQLRLDPGWSSDLLAMKNLTDVYDLDISAILANNGNDNVSTSSTPSTVVSPNSQRSYFGAEGALSFGRGAFHEVGKSLMGSSDSTSQDGFAYAHSAAQWMLINTAFGEAPYRANDRLENAGPVDGWPLEFGSSTTVMLFDGDKNHAWQGTKRYFVQVGWYERSWTVCWSGRFPYPCMREDWRVVEKTVTPAPRSVTLAATSLGDLATSMQTLLCGAGNTEIKQRDGSMFSTCAQTIDSSTTFTFETPYQDVAVSTPQWFTTYYWRFATDNGTFRSGYTGWSSFYRSF